MPLKLKQLNQNEVHYNAINENGFTFCLCEVKQNSCNIFCGTPCRSGLKTWPQSCLYFEGKKFVYFEVNYMKKPSKLVAIETRLIC